MEYSKDGDGWMTFIEHWEPFLPVFIVSIVMLIRGNLMHASLETRTWFFATTFALLSLGGGLISYAKLPAYRSGIFFLLD